MSETVTEVKAYQWYAGGQWRDVSGGKLFDDFGKHDSVLDLSAGFGRLGAGAGRELGVSAQRRSAGVEFG